MDIERRVRINRVMKTPTEIERGLMDLKRLPKDAGALFCMKETRRHVFWMKNTYVSLDLIFLDEVFRVVGTLTGAIPHDETPLQVDTPSKYIIEIKSGYVDAHDIQVGNIIRPKYNPIKKSTKKRRTPRAKNGPL
jgi:uncharacterized membrane protein (UPF0127 family)